MRVFFDQPYLDEGKGKGKERAKGGARSRSGSLDLFTFKGLVAFINLFNFGGSFFDELHLIIR